MNLYLKTFDIITNLEIMHSFFQCSKILRNNNMSYINMITNKEFNNDSDDSDDSDDSIMSKRSSVEFNNYKETTHIFSYYFLKLFIIYDYKNFLESRISLRDLSINFIDIGGLFNYIIEYSNHKNIVSNFKFIEALHEFLEANKNSDVVKGCGDINFVLSNFRMSILEH